MTTKPAIPQRALIILKPAIDIAPLPAGHRPTESIVNCTLRNIGASNYSGLPQNLRVKLISSLPGMVRRWTSVKATLPGADLPGSPRFPEAEGMCRGREWDVKSTAFHPSRHRTLDGASRMRRSRVPSLLALRTLEGRALSRPVA